MLDILKMSAASDWKFKFLASMEDGITVRYEDTTLTFWLDTEGRYHRDLLPALICKSQDDLIESWFTHGQLVKENFYDHDILTETVYHNGNVGKYGSAIIEYPENTDDIVYYFQNNDKLIVTDENEIVSTTSYGRGLDYAVNESGKADGILHRVDGPAVEYSNGGYEYWVDGKLHREDGPAIWHPPDERMPWHSVDITELYYLHGKLHRTDGPAYTKNGKKKYYIHGVRIPKSLLYLN